MGHLKTQWQPRGAAALAMAMATGCAQAQTATPTQFYGLINLGATSQQLSGQQRVSTLANGDATTSFYGIRGGEDLGDGMVASFMAEGFFRADTGEVGRGNSDALFQRQLWLALSSQRLGTLRVGRLGSPNWLTTIKFGVMGGASMMPYVMQTYLPSAIEPMITSSGASDASWANSVGYLSPVVGGFSAMVVSALREGGTTGKRIGASLTYEEGPFAAAVAYERLDGMALQFGAPAAPLATVARPSFVARENHTTQLAGSYDWAVVKASAQYSATGMTDLAGRTLRMRTAQLGASVPIGMGNAFVSGARTTKDDSAGPDQARNTILLGYDYRLSRRTDVYVASWHDKVSGLAAGTSYTLGLRHSF